jgi:hypothetical protein
MSVYKLATSLGAATEKDLGWLLTEFEPFQLNPNYSWVGRTKLIGGNVNRDKWPTVVPVHGPRVPHKGEVEYAIEKMIKISWEFAEPAAGVLRGQAGGHNYNPAVVGTRGMPQSLATVFVPPVGYQPQVRPTVRVLEVNMPDHSAIAQDWDFHLNLERTNAVAFRADKRPPYDILVKKPPPPWSPGFNPPITRQMSKEPNYLKNTIYSAFRSYLKRRYDRDIGVDNLTFVAALNKELVTPETQELVYEYLVWLSITKKESAHMGRRVEYEGLKEWISTSRCLDASLAFALMGSPPTPGWMYIVIVWGGYVVPFRLTEDEVWGTHEAEIAQFGSIPAERIVGFCHFDDYAAPDTSIFIRKSFRKDEPAACDAMFDALSGKTPKYA